MQKVEYTHIIFSIFSFLYWVITPMLITYFWMSHFLSCFSSLFSPRCQGYKNTSTYLNWATKERFFFLSFLLQDICFTMLCWFLTHINTNQPPIHIRPLPPESPPSHAAPPPTPPGCHRALTGAPVSHSKFLSGGCFLVYLASLHASTSSWGDRYQCFPLCFSSHCSSLFSYFQGF